MRVNSGNEGGNYFIALVEEIFSEVGSTEGGGCWEEEKEDI